MQSRDFHPTSQLLHQFHLNDDFVDFLNALKECSVEYILVGGYAVIYHGYNRTTGDLDVWVNPTKENYRKLILAFNKFGLSLFDMTEELFNNEYNGKMMTVEYDELSETGVPLRAKAIGIRLIE